MKISHKLAPLGVAIAMLVGATAAFAQDDAAIADLVAAAKAEGGLMIYSGANTEQLQRYADGFKSEYGIDVQIQRLTGAQTSQRFATETAAGVHLADIVGTSESSYYDDNPDWFVDMSQAHLPNYDKWPDDAKSKYRTVITRGVLGLIYNTDMVSKDEAPKDWKDVIDPKWKGKIILADTQSSVNWGGWLKVMHDSFGDDYIKSLAGQDFQIVASAQTGAQQVAAGAKPLNFPSASSFALSLKSEGAPIEYAFMAEPTVTNRFNFGAVAAAPHPNAARLFMNWLLSDPGITATCTDNEVMSPGDPEGKLGCMAKPTGNVVEIADGLDDAEMTKLFDMLGVK